MINPRMTFSGNSSLNQVIPQTRSSRFRSPVEPYDDSDMPSLPGFLEYRDADRRKQFDLQKEMMNFQSELKLRDLAKQMALEKQANFQPPPDTNAPKNVVYQGQYSDFARGVLGPLYDEKSEKNRIAADRNRITEENYDKRNEIAQQAANTKQQLAALHNLSDSEKLQLLQDGRIDLQTLKDAASMARTEATVKGAQVRTETTVKGQKDIQETKGKQALEQIGARGTETRKTKETPSADAGVTANLPTQQIKAQQLRANHAIQNNPRWSKWITVNPNTGGVDIVPPATNAAQFGRPSQDEYNLMKDFIQGNTITAPKGNTTDNTPPPPEKAAAIPFGSATKPESTSDSGSVEMITPDGKSTRMVPANHVELAKQQGYKLKGIK